MLFMSDVNEWVTCVRCTSPAVPAFSAAAGSKTQTSPRDVTQKRLLGEGLDCVRRRLLIPDSKKKSSLGTLVIAEH